jgi:hypothetical protein
MGSFGNRYRVFTDDLFNGSEYTFKMQVRINPDEEEDDNDYYYTANYPDPVSLELYVELQHLTRDYYLYLKSRANARTNEDFGGMFTEPIQVYTNVEGGIGILGSYASTICMFLLLND